MTEKERKFQMTAEESEYSLYTSNQNRGTHSRNAPKGHTGNEKMHWFDPGSDINQ